MPAPRLGRPSGSRLQLLCGELRLQSQHGSADFMAATAASPSPKLRLDFPGAGSTERLLQPPALRSPAHDKAGGEQCTGETTRRG